MVKPELVTHTERRASKKPRGSAKFASSKQNSPTSPEPLIYATLTRYGIFYAVNNNNCL